MQWVVPGIIIFTLLFMSGYSPKVAFFLLGILLTVTGITIYVTTDDASLNQHKLPLEDIHIEYPTMTPSYAGGYRFNARLVNTHPLILLKESVVSITMLDCKDQFEQDCRVVGQKNARINVKIPATQSRDISQVFNFHPVKPIGKIRWKYHITRTRS